MSSGNLSLNSFILHIFKTSTIIYYIVIIAKYITYCQGILAKIFVLKCCRLRGDTNLTLQSFDSILSSQQLDLKSEYVEEIQYQKMLFQCFNLYQFVRDHKPHSNQGDNIAEEQHAVATENLENVFDNLLLMQHQFYTSTSQLINITQYIELVESWNPEEFDYILKKANLLLELGKLDQAKKILEILYKTIEQESLTDTNRSNYYNIAREGILLYFLQNICVDYNDKKLDELYNRLEINIPDDRITSTIAVTASNMRQLPPCNNYDAIIQLINQLLEHIDDKISVINIDRYVSNDSSSESKSSNYVALYSSYLEKIENKLAIIECKVDYTNSNEKKINRIKEHILHLTKKCSSLQPDSFAKRLRQLTVYDCNPYIEIQYIKDKIYKDNIFINRIKDSFYIDRALQVQKSTSNHANIYSSYAYLSLFDALFIPMVIRNIAGNQNLILHDEYALQKSLENLCYYMPNMTIGLFLRAGNTSIGILQNIDIIFTRVYILHMTYETIQAFVTYTINFVYNHLDEIFRDYEKNDFGINYCNNMLAMISRLVCKIKPRDYEKILENIVLKIYKTAYDHRGRYYTGFILNIARNTMEILQNIIANYTIKDLVARDILDLFLQFPILKDFENDIHLRRSFISPFDLLLKRLDSTNNLDDLLNQYHTRVVESSAKLCDQFHNIIDQFDTTNRYVIVNLEIKRQNI